MKKKSSSVKSSKGSNKSQEVKKSSKLKVQGKFMSVKAANSKSDSPTTFSFVSTTKFTGRKCKKKSCNRLAVFPGDFCANCIPSK